MHKYFSTGGLAQSDENEWSPQQQMLMANKSKPIGYDDYINKFHQTPDSYQKTIPNYAPIPTWQYERSEKEKKWNQANIIDQTNLSTNATNKVFHDFLVDLESKENVAPGTYVQKALYTAAMPKKQLEKQRLQEKMQELQKQIEEQKKAKTNYWQKEMGDYNVGSMPLNSIRQVPPKNLLAFINWTNTLNPWPAKLLPQVSEASRLIGYNKATTLKGKLPPEEEEKLMMNQAQTENEFKTINDRLANYADVSIPAPQDDRIKQLQDQMKEVASRYDNTPDIAYRLTTPPVVHMESPIDSRILRKKQEALMEREHKRKLQEQSYIYELEVRRAKELFDKFQKTPDSDLEQLTKQFDDLNQELGIDRNRHTTVLNELEGERSAKQAAYNKAKAKYDEIQQQFSAKQGKKYSLEKQLADMKEEIIQRPKRIEAQRQATIAEQQRQSAIYAEQQRQAQIAAQQQAIYMAQILAQQKEVARKNQDAMDKLRGVGKYASTVSSGKSWLDSAREKNPNYDRDIAYYQKYPHLDIMPWDWRRQNGIPDDVRKTW